MQLLRMRRPKWLRRKKNEAIIDKRTSLAKVRMQLLRLGYREWFRRVWILQEYVLAVKQPIILMGRYVINYGAFTAAWTGLVSTFLTERGIDSVVLHHCDPCAYQYVKQSRAQSHQEAQLRSSSTQDVELELASDI